ncbi:MAG: 2-C-methyl-D-erythritol 4-phosphate cytidylyltransferase [Actinomycetota bacterium]|jgi:2-C-methyl-D-erythritol 4-phosphate cytidylyltransferase/2-C-methyl-D-erythritol 2,4-cyclodiphosphate synthase|nr:2-C-methyl-D-erythritol 4-phosphate cytidylyltransferase [Actinomycetota bacterium]
MDAVGLVLAAGAGRRLGMGEPKAFLPLGDAPILVWAVRSALACPSVGSLVVTAPAGFEDEARSALAEFGSALRVVTGGDTRQGSVRAALEHVAADAPFVVIHDAARPFASPELFTRVLEAVEGDAAGALPALPVADTVKQVADGWVTATLPRNDLVLVQTPQAFRSDPLRESHRLVTSQDLTDDAAVLERAGYRVRAIAGDPTNVKITTMLDLVVARERVGA